MTGKKPMNLWFGDLGMRDYTREPQAVVIGVRDKCGSALSIPWTTTGVTEEKEQRDATMLV